MFKQSIFIRLLALSGILTTVQGQQPGIISTAAGNGTSLYNGDNVVATSAAVGSPSQLALDANGNLYIADVMNSRIRKVDKLTGIITTVAGGGNGSDGGLATNALLSNPCGLTIDSSGNLYITETCMAASSGGGGGGGGTGTANLSRIRKVDAATGIISTIAGSATTSGSSGDGGLATAALLNTPGFVAVDAAGNVYVADVMNHRIRKITAATQIISTVAGIGTAGFAGDGGPAIFATLNTPIGVSVDAAGNLLIADSFNHRIRKVDAVTGNISTVAGNGVAGFNGDGALATNSSLNLPYQAIADGSGNLLIADAQNFRVRRVDAATGVITTIAGGGFGGDGGQATAAGLTSTVSVAISTSGQIYLSDRQANRVRTFTQAPPAVSTTTVLTATPNPALTSDNVIIRATVTPSTAAGSIQFSLNGSPFGSLAPLNAGAAQVTLSGGPTGEFTFGAQFVPAAGFLGSQAAPVTVSIKSPVNVMLSSSVNPSALGQSVTLSALISNPQATGTVQFLDGAVSIGSGVVTNGMAMLTTAQLAAGTRALTAVYSGDANFAAATSAVLPQQVNGPSLSCRVTYQVTNQWSTGFGAAMTVRNTGTTVINSWAVTWTWAGNQRITQSWNSLYTQTGANARLANTSWNRVIQPGQTLTGIGFNASYSGSNPRPTAFFLNGVLCSN
jgi:heat shock protein HslJ